MARNVLSGDGAKIDADGYLWLLGRVDDIMLVAGHNISTMEVESALVDHPSVAESAVVGITDEIKGQAIAAFVTLKEGGKAGAKRMKSSKATWPGKSAPLPGRKRLFSRRNFPKRAAARSCAGFLRDIAEGRALGDVTTLADVHVIESLKEKYQEEA